jgi:uncharacterized protein (TIRG00374 family)
MFINTFGLGTVGGDVARALLLKPTNSQRLEAFSSVFADRIHGLAVLLIVGAIAVLITQYQILGIENCILNLLAIVGIICTLLGWFYCSKIINVFSNFLCHSNRWSHPLIIKYCDKLKTIATELTLTFKLTYWDLIKATALSALMHLGHILMYYLLAQSLNMNLPFSYLCIVVPIVNVASSLPISINGLGVRESLLVLLLSTSQISNVSPELAVLIGVLFTLIVTIISGIGGVIGGIKQFVEAINHAPTNK